MKGDEQLRAASAGMAKKDENGGEWRRRNEERIRNGDVDILETKGVFS